tara:strand:+ start:283 stop:513 length:231 start_codon:yes stop_codon:yes gene_type:complete
MKKLLLSVLAILLFFCALGAKAEEIAEVSSPDQEQVIRYLQEEDIYQGTLGWKGNQLTTKLNYDKVKKKKKLIETH